METSCVRPDTSDVELILGSIDPGGGYCDQSHRRMGKFALDVPVEGKTDPG